MALVRDRCCSARNYSLRCFAKSDTNILRTYYLRSLLDRITLGNVSRIIANALDRHRLLTGIRALAEFRHIVYISCKCPAVALNCDTGPLLFTVVCELSSSKSNRNPVLILQIHCCDSCIDSCGSSLIIRAAGCRNRDRSCAYVLAGHGSVA